MNNEMNTQDAINEREQAKEEAKAIKKAQREESNASNTQALRTAATIASKSPETIGAIAKGVMAADKVTGGAVTRAAGKAMTVGNTLSGPAGRMAQRNINRFGKVANSRLGNAAINRASKSSSDSGQKNAALREKTGNVTPREKTTNATRREKTTNTTPTSASSASSPSYDDSASATVTKAIKKFKIPIMIIIVLVVGAMFIYATIISSIEEIMGDSSSRSRTTGTITTKNNVNGVGNYFTSGDDDYFNSSVVYVNDNNESTTYSINDLIIGGVYALTADVLPSDVYKVYAVLLRSNILSDSDGVIEAADYKFADATSSPSYETIQKAVEDTSKELLLDDNNNIITTTFTVDDSETNNVSLRRVVEIVEYNNYDYKKTVEMLFDGKYTCSEIKDIIISSSISLELKNTTDSMSLNRPIKEFLEINGSSIEEMNNYISSSVEPVYGTGEGVATAAVALINFLYDGFGYKLPYYWNGKYSNVGINPSFGKYKPSYTDSGQVYRYISFDCSGLAQWAIINGGFNDPGTGTEHFAEVFKNRCDITSDGCIGQVGDLINYRTNPDKDGNTRGHVQVIVSVNIDNNIYYIAESSTHGVVVTTRDMHKGRNDATVYVLNMTDYYKKNVRNKG